MSSDFEYHVRRVRHDLEDPWRIPEGVPTVPLVRAEDGEACRLQTEFSVYHDGSRMYVIFRCADDHVVATMHEHDAALWKEDVVEVFCAPSSLERYFEIEVNPLGTTFDAVIHSPEGVRESMSVDRGWTCEGLRASIRRVTEDGMEIVDTMIMIPFASLEVDPPGAGDAWRVNFFRVDRSPQGDEFMAWRPTGKSPPDFHVPSRFGSLVFE